MAFQSDCDRMKVVVDEQQVLSLGDDSSTTEALRLEPVADEAPSTPEPQPDVDVDDEASPGESAA